MRSLSRPQPARGRQLWCCQSSASPNPTSVLTRAFHTPCSAPRKANVNRDFPYRSCRSRLEQLARKTWNMPSKKADCYERAGFPSASQSILLKGSLESCLGRSWDLAFYGSRGLAFGVVTNLTIAHCDTAGIVLLIGTTKNGASGLALGSHKRSYIKPACQRYRNLREPPGYRDVLNFTAYLRLETSSRASSSRQLPHRMAYSFSIRQLHSIMRVKLPREFAADPSGLTSGDKRPNSEKIVEP